MNLKTHFVCASLATSIDELSILLDVGEQCVGVGNAGLVSLWIGEHALQVISLHPVLDLSDEKSIARVPRTNGLRNGFIFFPINCANLKKKSIFDKRIFVKLTFRPYHQSGSCPNSSL